MKKSELKKARSAVKTIANQESMTADEVREEMKAAISEGMQSTDPAVQEMWRNIPCKGSVPEPEELIAWLAEQVRERIKN